MKKIYLCCLLCFSVMLNYAQTQNNDSATTKTSKTIVPFIDTLQDGEQFTIHYSSTGCFHNTKETMTFQRENNTYYVIFNGEKKELDSNFLKKTRTFEKQLARQGNYGCTTVDSYLVTYNNVERIANDGSCSWNGYRRLKKLFGFA
ncbi:hypothetical protein [Kordia sp.]|uniref:hypothetical protein n=1 Tax=Kordia sp. TaxID=1965332 RepID=UPI003D6B8327